ncbi:MAG: restriction endonuclease [Acidimicrobiales bacterium]
MTKTPHSLERLVTALARRISGPTALALAAVFYTLGVAIPLALGLPKFDLVLCSFACALFAASVPMAWLLVQLENSHRRKLVDWTTSLRLLSAEEFEWLVGEIFRREGFEVEETGNQENPDGNIDLRLLKDGQRKIVQCKRWASWLVGVDEVRKLAGTLMRERLCGRDGIFVTLSSFTVQAEDEAKAIGLTLIDGRKLDDMRQRVRRSEPCPRCGQPMAFGNSRRGWWFYCLAGDCDGKRDLGSDEGRAIEFLIQGPQRGLPASKVSPPPLICEVEDHLADQLRRGR